MFLIKKGNKKFICNDYSLKYKVDQGWEVIKPIFDIPRTICYLPISKRSIVDIVLWYQDKIEKLTLELERRKKDLKIFKELIK